MTLFLSFIALFPRLLLGFCIVHSVWKGMDGKSLLIKLFLAAGIGFGVSSLLGFLWIWLGLPLSVYAILETVAAVAWTGWTLYKDRSSFRFTLPTDKSNIAWASILAFGVLLFVLNLFFYALQYPHGRPDAWINWNVAARFIYLGGADWQLTFLRQWDHPDYPLYMAMTNAVTWVFLGKASTWGVIAIHFTISLFTAGLLFSFVNYFRGFKQAVLSAVLFMSLPFVVDQGMRQYADLLLAYLILAAGGLTLLYIQTNNTRLAILVGLLTGLGGWAKNEGLPTILGFAIVWFMLALKGGKQNRSSHGMPGEVTAGGNAVSREGKKSPSRGLREFSRIGLKIRANPRNSRQMFPRSETKHLYDVPETLQPRKTFSLRAAWQRYFETLRYNDKAAFKDFLFGLAFPLVVIALFKLFLAPPNDLLSAQGSAFDNLLDAGRYAIIFKQAGLVLWNIGGAPIPLIGLIILMAVLFGRSTARIQGAWIIVTVIAFQLTVYFIIYLLTPLDLAFHLNTSLDRLYMHVLPLALLWFFLWLKSPEELSSYLSQ